jgi:hypothetical protein
MSMESMFPSAGKSLIRFHEVKPTSLLLLPVAIELSTHRMSVKQSPLTFHPFNRVSRISSINSSTWWVLSTKKQRRSYLYSDLEDLSLTRTVDPSQIIKLEEQLAEIERERVGGKFMDAEGQITSGQAILYQLLRYLLYRQSF